MDKINLNKQIADFLKAKRDVMELHDTLSEINMATARHPNRHVIPLINPSKELMAKAHKMTEENDEKGLLELAKEQENNLIMDLGKACYIKETEEEILHGMCYAILCGDIEPEEPANIEAIETFCGNDKKHKGKTHYMFKITLTKESEKKTIYVESSARLDPIK